MDGNKAVKDNGDRSSDKHYVAIEHALRGGKKRYRYVVWRYASNTRYRQFLVKSLFGFLTESQAEREAEAFLQRHGYSYEWVSQS